MTRRKTPRVEFVPARPGSMPRLAEGSKRVLCARCRKHKVWLTPEMERHGMRAVCAACAPKREAPK